MSNAFRKFVEVSKLSFVLVLVLCTARLVRADDVVPVTSEDLSAFDSAVSESMSKAAVDARGAQRGGSLTDRPSTSKTLRRDRMRNQVTSASDGSRAGSESSTTKKKKSVSKRAGVDSAERSSGKRDSAEDASRAKHSGRRNGNK